MFIREQRFPISTGPLVAIAKAGLLAKGWSATGMTIRPERPAGTTADPLTRRMVSIRDDSGPVVGRIQSRRQGVNVWADSAVDAENICLDLMSIFEACPDGNPITATRGFSGPYKVPADNPLTVIVSTVPKPLTNFYFAFIADVKASAA